MLEAALKHVASFQYGDALPTDIRVEGDIRVFGSNGQTGAHNKANTLGPSIIVGRKGSFGKVTWSENPGFCIDTAYYIDKRHTKANLRWLYWVLQTLELDAVSEDTGVPGLSREKAYQAKLRLPDIDTQAAIASYLDRKTAAIDALIEKKERLIEEVRKYQEAVIAEAVAPREGWRKSNLKSLVSPLPKSPYPSGMAEEDGLYNFYVSGEKVKKTNQAEDHGMVLMIADGGKACIHLQSGRFSWSDHVIGLEFYDQRLASFIYHQLKNQEDIINSLGFRGASIPMLDKRWFMNEFYVLVPSPEEAEEIGKRITQIHSDSEYACSLARASIDELKKYRAAIISEAVTGKLPLPAEIQ